MRLNGAAARLLDPAELDRRLADLAGATGVVVAVSGGPDSTALIGCVAAWARTAARPPVLAATVDHGLRPGSATEAEAVGRLAAALGLPHRILAWEGGKPRTGVQAAARAARRDLLTKLAREVGASHVASAHTRDDQAETVLMRLARGSGIGGLGGMARDTSLVPAGCSPPPSANASSPSPRKRGERPGEGLLLTRPFLDLPKSRLVATLRAHGISFAEDVSNSDPRFTRVRWRALMPALSGEGLDARSLARLAARARRADAALELATLGAERALVRSKGRQFACDRCAFAALPDEIRLRLLGRMIARTGSEGPVELGKLETMLDAVNGILIGRRGQRLKRTLAGAIVAIGDAEITVEPAPARRLQGKGPAKA